MIILGLDPGTKSPGYAVIRFEKNTPALLAHGVVPINSAQASERLLELRRFLKKIIAKYKPTHAGVERLFFSKNRKTALSVSQARGVLLELLAEQAIWIEELLPSEIKIAVTGSGNADKIAVASMAARFLPGTLLKKDDNATDAVAIALTTGFKLALRQRLST